MATKIKDLDELQKSLIEHTDALKKFKHDMFMKFNNTNSKKKQSKILDKVEHIYKAMDFVFTHFTEVYNELEDRTDNEELKNTIMLQLLEFRSEMMEMKRG